MLFVIGFILQKILNFLILIFWGDIYGQTQKAIVSYFEVEVVLLFELLFCCLGVIFILFLINLI